MGTFVESICHGSMKGVSLLFLVALVCLSYAASLPDIESTYSDVQIVKDNGYPRAYSRILAQCGKEESFFDANVYLCQEYAKFTLKSVGGMALQLLLCGRKKWYYNKNKYVCRYL